MSTDAELAGEISIDPSEFINALKRASVAFDDFSGKLEAGNGFKAVQSNAAAMSVAIGTMVASAATKLGELASSAISAGFAFNSLKEQSTIAFTNLLGSGQAAKKFLDELAAFAARTPFEFPELVKSAQRLTAMGFASREVIPMLTAVGNAVSAMGGSAAQIDRVTTALTQMKAKGKVSAEEMMQLAEAGIPAWQILADKIGKSIPEAMKLAEKGAVSADVAIEGLIEGMQSKFGGMMEAQATTWQGMLSTLSDTTAQMAGQIMEPLFTASKDTLTKILAGLPEFQKQFNDAWKSIVTEVGNSLSELRPIVSAALNDVKSLWEGQHNEIINITKFAWNAVYAGFIKPAVDGISRLISTASRAFAGDWEGAMNRLVASTDLAGNKILGTVGRWVQALARVSGLITGISGIANAASAGGAGTGGAVDTFWKDAAGSMREKSKAAEDAAYAAGQRVSKAVASGITGGGGGKGKGSNEAEKAMRELLSSINEYVAATGNGVRITEQAWVNSSEAIRQSMVQQRNEFVANKEATSQLYLELKGGLLTVYPQLGAAISDYIRNMEKSTIALESASTKILEFIQPSKALAAEVKKAEKDLEDSNKKIQKMNDDAAKEAEKAAKKIHDAMLDQFEDLSRKLPESWNVIIDGIISGSGRAGDAVYELGVKIKGWAGDVIGVIDTLPGKFGDAAKKIVSTVDQWVQFANKVLAVLNRLDSDIPGSIGGIFQTLTGLFKKTQTAATSSIESISGVIKNASEDWAGTLEKLSTGKLGSAAGNAGTTTGTNFASGFLSKLGLIGSGITTFFGTRGKGDAIGLAGAIAAGAQIGGAFGGGFGAAAGAAIGAFIGGFKSDSKLTRFFTGGFISLIFGGKSDAEKKKIAEEKARQEQGIKDNAAILTNQAAQSVEATRQALMESASKFAALADQLRDHTSLPKATIQAFFKDLTRVMNNFADLASQWSAESIGKAKTLAEGMQPVVDVIGGALEAFNVLPSFIPVADKILDEFFVTFSKVVTKFGVMAAEIPNNLEKQARKFAERTAPIIELIGSTVAALFGDKDKQKGVIDAKLIDPAIFDTLEIGIKLSVEKMSNIASLIDNSLLKTTKAFSEKALPIFELIGNVVETFGKFKDLVVPSTSSLDAVLSFAQVVIEKVSAMASNLNTEFLGRAEQIANRAGAILTFVSGFMEGLGVLGTYQAVSSALLDTVTNDFKKILAWGDELISLGESGITKFDTLQSVIARMAAAMKGAASGISALSGSIAGSGSGSGITANLQYQGSGLGSLRSGGGSSSTSSTVVQHNTFQITLSLKDLEELAEVPDKVRWLERKLNDSGSRTGQKAQGYASF
jgi:tape measure domain-containing protein